MIQDPGGRKDVDSDSLENALDDIVRAAELMIDNLGTATLAEGGHVREVEGELIEGLEDVTMIVEAPGYTRRDLAPVAKEYELMLQGPDFRARADLSCKIDPGTAELEYRNGIASIVVRKVV